MKADVLENNGVEIWPVTVYVEFALIFLKKAFSFPCIVPASNILIKCVLIVVAWLLIQRSGWMSTWFNHSSIAILLAYRVATKSCYSQSQILYNIIYNKTNQILYTQESHWFLFTVKYEDNVIYTWTIAVLRLFSIWILTLQWKAFFYCI